MGVRSSFFRVGEWHLILARWAFRFALVLLAKETRMPKKYVETGDLELERLLRTKASDGRTSTVEVIEILEEFESRKLYLRLGFGSLVEFCIKELKFSESAAYRRVAAMRLAREIPEVKESILDGSLNLVNISRAQSLFRAEDKNLTPFSLTAKKELLKSIENKSRRQAERIMAEKSDFILQTIERCIAVKNNKYQITIEIDESLMEKVELFKNLISHRNPNPSLAECFEAMADIAIEKLDLSKATTVAAGVGSDAPPPAVAHRKRPKYISAAVRREIWRKAEGKCTFVNGENHQRCNSIFQLEVDHIIPQALGGTSEIENLRLVCRAHNILYARAEFGDEFMNQFSKKPTG